MSVNAMYHNKTQIDSCTIRQADENNTNLALVKEINKLKKRPWQPQFQYAPGEVTMLRINLLERDLKLQLNYRFYLKLLNMSPYCWRKICKEGCNQNKSTTLSFLA